MLTIVIVGLPNVGKSTLFNRLIGRKIAIVNDIPGVTRDRREGVGKISEARFKIIDTGGLDRETAFFQPINDQVKMAIEQADVVFFTINAKDPISENNKHFASWTRRIAGNKPVILLANKAENSKKCHDFNDFSYLKFIGPVYISAEHNLGMIDLYDALRPFLPTEDIPDDHYHNPDRAKIAIVGRPNVGKSTLVNNLLNENRMIISACAGTTRDSIDTTYFYNDQEILLIDTAGIRKKSNVTDNLEVISVKDSIDSIRRSNVVVLVIDATMGIENQDLAIAEIASNEGKGLLVALNKWDLINQRDRSSLLQIITQDQLSKLGFVAPIIEISALKNVNCLKIIEKCLELSTALRTQVSTSKLNKWLLAAVDKHPHPHHKGSNVRLKYITQIGKLPPSFLIMSNFPDYLDKSYIQYLTTHFRSYFKFEGIPIKFNFKKNQNRYDPKRGDR